jgi:hypothetical protein
MGSVDPTLLAKISADRALGSALLFSHRHPQESPAFHVEMIDLWRAQDEFVLIEAFREGAKTTLAEEFLTMEGCFGNFFYWLLIGETYEKACNRLGEIDRECRTNVRLHHLFGGLVLARKSNENKIWFKSGAMLEAVGWDQELQSFKAQAHRPGGAYLDDIENKERVRDKAAVDENMRKFWLELVPALDKTRRRIRFAQTRRAEDCMVVRFSTNPEWVYRGYPICDRDPDDPEAVSLWPQRYPIAWIRAEKRRYESAGMLSEFLQSYMLQATNPAEKPFTDDMLRTIEVSPYHWMPRYAIYDPGRTTHEKRTRDYDQSDRYGKVVVSRLGSKILVHESKAAHWKPSELIDDMFAVQDKHSPAKIGVEKNSLDDWIMQPIRIEMMKRGVALPLQALQAPQDRNKNEFILGLQPFAQANDIVLVGGRGMHPELCAEWANFPSGSRDVMNALAYALRMFSGSPVYEDFSAANIAEAPEPKLGEEIYVAFNASPSEVVAVAVIREGRRLCVAGDFAVSGAVNDAVKTVAFEVRASFPRANFQCWVPAEVYDQGSRIPLVSALRNSSITAYRAEHSAIARGCLSDRIRTTWRNQRLLTVDKRARTTLNALAAGYALPVQRGGRMAAEPEPGLSRLAAEALESLTSVLDKSINAGDAMLPKGANIAHTPGGAAFVTAHPTRR